MDLHDYGLSCKLVSTENEDPPAPFCKHCDEILQCLRAHKATVLTALNIAATMLCKPRKQCKRGVDAPGI